MVELRSCSFNDDRFCTRSVDQVRVRGVFALRMQILRLSFCVAVFCKVIIGGGVIALGEKDAP